MNWTLGMGIAIGTLAVGATVFSEDQTINESTKSVISQTDQVKTDETKTQPKENTFPAMNAAELDRYTRTNRPFRKPVPITLTVGQDSGDLRGTDDKVIQAGVDYLNRMGGGVLQILPGTYTLRNAIHLRPHITLKGSGENTVLKRTASVTTPLVRDADWYEYAVQVKDPAGFERGNGILLTTLDEQKSPKYLFATVTAVQGNVVFIDRRPELNFWISGEATASTLFSLLSGREVNDVKIEDIVLDGNRENCSNVNDNFGASVFMQYCDRWEFRNVTSRNYNGDGFSFQVCNDIRFENCEALNNADLGFHPGSGSQRPSFRNCLAKGNNQGFFFCWGVSDGVVEDCVSSGNIRFGVNFGHRDTENLIRNCTIESNGEVGVLFREERWAFCSGDRNRIENCVIRDNGIGIDIRWLTKDVTIRNCRFENLSGVQKTGIRIGAEVQRVALTDNTYVGSARDVEDLRTSAETSPK